ncbi:hypothetical protein PPL_05965 [Heterostelium album PN500]|uniref:Uncharacterized protein n=1 Tax=Heterostelium pallidum (strain ATCC 26659 / Pp 5 / PN500) TaxID=670386 RepID=D3BBU6_HETP5|nr:hypothetical protein PPL_05965 [Heterostelium album PN500]EFA81129.1 hypothetical protein PPL_05965 [Heterostelium album PN500]|eukprot:XP_020433247.1 hypothetical protein PPL_05965 [Heterostelium album PN500]
MVSFSKIMTYGGISFVVGSLLMSIYDQYQDYVEEEGFTQSSLFGSSGGDDSLAPRMKKPKKLSQADDERLVMEFEAYRKIGKEALQEEDLPRALEIFEIMYGIVSKSITLQNVDHGNTLFMVFRLANATQNTKKMVKYAQILIDGNGPNPQGQKLEETLNLYEVILKDLTDDKKYNEAIELAKSIPRKYNLKAEQLSNHYSILANLYNKIDAKSDWLDAVHKSVEYAKKSGNTQFVASCLIDLIEFYVAQKNDEKIDETVEEALAHFPGEQKISFLRVTAPIYFAHGYYEKYIKGQEEIIPLFETKVNNNTENSESERLKLRNYLLNEINRLGCGYLIVGREDEAIEKFNEVKKLLTCLLIAIISSENLIYTIPSVSKYFKTKEAHVEEESEFSIILACHENVTVPENSVVVCEFENPADPDAPTIVEKDANTREIVLEVSDVQGIDVTKAYTAKITLYNKDNREEPLSKHYQILSPQSPIKGTVDQMFQQLL